jgi:inorganic phosphate transporter, PiT family
VTVAMLVVAVAFALVNGANTGATLLATSLTLTSIGHPAGLVLLAAGVAVGPLLVGTGVASTFVTQMQAPGESGAELAMVCSVAVTLIVVLGLTRLGIPTGLTLAFVGALAGYALTAGSRVPWESVGKVLAMMAVAPLVGGIIAYLVVSVLARRLRTRHAGRSLGRMHLWAFPLLAIGYGASDGQKMLAIAAVALGTATPGGVVLSVPVLLGLGALFAIGSAAGFGRMATRMGRGVLPVRPLYAVTSETATSAALLGSAAIGAPVGVAQTLTGSLVGAGGSQGWGRVRWGQVGTIVVAWGVTLPLAFALAAVTGVVAGGIA